MLHIIKPFKKWGLYLLSTALFVISSQALAVKVSEPAADFTLKSTAGKNIRLLEQRGDIIVLNFWASWCGPCRKEMPILQNLHNKYKDLGVQVWGVNVEQENKAGRNFIADLDIDFPIFFDASNKVPEAYQIEAMPTTVIIGKRGKVRHVFLGYKKGYEQKYSKAIKALIREK